MEETMTMHFARAAALGAILAATAATGAFAKSHDQGQTAVPGMDVGTETVGPAQTLGTAKGNRPADKGPKDSPAVANAGR
jgi:hypothetical protein